MDGTTETLGEGHIETRRRRFDVDEYHRMSEAGILHEEDRIELIDGELVEMSPIGAPHMAAVMKLTRVLSSAAGDGAWVSVQNSLRLDRLNEPEPDVVLLRLRSDAYEGGPPLADDALLVVEVAQPSLHYDQSIKLPLYARHGIPEVWIVDVDGRTVSVCREPAAGAYASVTRAGEADMIAPAALPGVRIRAAELLGKGG